jgi:hypothetical protein
MEQIAEELLQQLAQLEQLLDEAIRRAGQGSGPEFERRLGAPLRSLRPLLDPDDLRVAEDAIEAAQRVMGAADPQAPLLMLALARKHLAGVIHRQARKQGLPTAA